MFRKKYHINFTYDEMRSIINILMHKRELMIEQGKFTDPVDELLVKFAISAGVLIA